MDVFNNLVAHGSQLILHASWQAAFVAGLIFILLILTRRIVSSQLRYALLIVVLLKFATPPFLNFPTGMISQYTIIRSTKITDERRPIVIETPATTTIKEPLLSSNSTTKNTLPVLKKSGHRMPDTASNILPMTEVTKPVPGFSWLSLLMSAYLFGTVAFVILLIHRYRLVRRIVRSGEIQHDGFLSSELKKISKQLKMKSLPELRISDKTDAPFAMGVFRPVIVLPRLIEEQLQPDQLTIVIAHELAHIRRRDLLIGWLETLVSIVWWFHPALWWLRKSLRQTREDCCDDILLANQLAEPERYCETLIDAAARQSTKLTEPLVLGFVQREHPVARRIRRLMDGSLFRGERLRFRALVVTLLLALIVLPGMRPERQAVTQTTLQGLFGGWRNLPFRIDASEEAVIKECRKIAQTYFGMKNKQRIFAQQETREKLEAILDKHPKCFYAQNLLGTWHRMNGDLELSTQLLNESLANAPIVLTQKYKFGNGAPLKGAVIQSLRIECIRVKNHSLDSSLALRFVGLLTDSEGNVYLPVYDTVCRLSAGSPVGYFVETNRMGLFESKSLNGILPDIMVWRKWSQPRDFTRTAAESSYLRDARGTDTLELASGPNRYKLGGVARGQADGTMTLENGKGKRLSSLSTELPVIKNGAFMDHALIHLSEPRPARFNIAEVQILDSQTKILLQSFQEGAGITPADKSKIHLFSMWETLPDIVDLVLKVYNYDADTFLYKIPPKVGTTMQHVGTTFEITYLAEGNHQGWSSRDGFYGEARSNASTSEIIFAIKGDRQMRVSLWVISKNGRKQNLKNYGWVSSSGSGEPIRIMLPLDEIDHFELLPYVKPETIYFEKIQLPVRQTPLDQRLPVIEFPIDGVARKFTSDLFSPLRVHFESQRGIRYSGSSSGMNGFELFEGPEDKHYSLSNATVTWEYWATVYLNHRLEVSVKSEAQKIVPGSYYCSGRWGAASSSTVGFPLETVESAHLQFLPKKTDE